ncbi:MAG: hypothetical protein AAB470_01250 [Patescibacteria group bacterium]
MRQLLELANKDNPMLVKYAKRWVATRNPSVKEEAKLPDPVTAARAWSRKSRRNFLITITLLIPCSALALATRVAHDVWHVHFGWFTIFPILVFVLFFLDSLRDFFHKPKDIIRFLETMTLLEWVPIKRRGGNITQLGPFPADEDWDPEEASSLLTSHLCALGDEIRRMEEKRSDIPWRVSEVEAKIAKLRKMFAERHHFFRRFFHEIPEGWDYYFKKY